MLIKKPSDVKNSEITREEDYFNRRRFMKFSALGLGSAFLGPYSRLLAFTQSDKTPAIKQDISKSRFSTDEELNDWEDITTYNNFYEFGTAKDDPSENAHTLQTKPWTVEVSGACAKPGTFGVEELIKESELEERIYRLRCVEAWSMVIPWVGVELKKVLDRFEPTSKAKFVEFTTLYDPKQMPGQKWPVLQWPYVEGLRMDEANHPLSIFAVGLYGRVLPNQNGAPIRLVVPWKYGFKSIKSIVKIRFSGKMPATTWNIAAPNEYGFYANVNPNVDHPRWSQARERRLGEFFKRDTIMFNGYGDQVARLYKGMDLKKWF